MHFSSRQLRDLEKAAKSVAGLRGGAKFDAIQKARQLYSKQAQLGMRSMSASAGGRFVNDIKKAFAGSAVDPTSQLFQNLAGSVASDFTRDIVRYARGGGASRLLGGILGQLGPVGRAVSLLLGNRAAAASIPDSAVRSAIELLHGLGFEVRVPGAGGTLTTHVPMGGRSTKPARFPTDRKRDYPIGATPPPEPGQAVTPDVGPQVGTFPGGQYVPMERVSGSSNVYAIGYSAETLTMRVQYLAAAVSAGGISGRGHTGRKRVKGKLGRTVTQRRHGPGPTYDYHGVPQSVFNRIASAGSKGVAIWDHLRVRGTVYGHQYDYELTAASVTDVVLPAKFQGRYTDQQRVARVTYVPRKAVGPGQFKARTMRQGTSTFRSLLPTVGLRK